MHRALTKRHVWIIAYCTGLFVLLSFANNMCTLALPRLADYFGTSDATMHYAFVLLLAGMGLSQLFFGWFSDVFGRKKSIRLGLCIYLLGALASITAQNIYLLLSSFFLQGLGIGFTLIVSKAIINDLFSNDSKSYKTSLWVVRGLAAASIISSLSPALSLTIAGNILNAFNWRYLFAFLGLFAVLVLIATHWIQETNNATAKNIKKSNPKSLRSLLGHYRKLLGNRYFLTYSLCLGILSSGIALYYVISPFIYLRNLHLSITTVAYLSFFTVASFMVGKAFISPALRRLGINRLTLVSLALAFIGGLILIISCLTHHFNIYTIILSCCLFILATGLFSPAMNAHLMQKFNNHAGAAMALLAVVISAVSGLSILFVSNFILFICSIVLPSNFFIIKNILYIPQLKLSYCCLLLFHSIFRSILLPFLKSF